MKADEYMLLAGAMACAIALSLFTGCATKNDAVAQAEKTEKNRPGIAETKAIAEEGFIYGLPIVMNYAAMYENIIDTHSPEYKAPFNVLYNEHRTFASSSSSSEAPLV